MRNVRETFAQWMRQDLKEFFERYHCFAPCSQIIDGLRTDQLLQLTGLCVPEKEVENDALLESFRKTFPNMLDVHPQGEADAARLGNLLLRKAYEQPDNEGDCDCKRCPLCNGHLELQNPGKEMDVYRLKDGGYAGLCLWCLNVMAFYPMHGTMRSVGDEEYVLEFPDETRLAIHRALADAARLRSWRAPTMRVRVSSDRGKEKATRTLRFSGGDR